MFPCSSLRAAPVSSFCYLRSRHAAPVVSSLAPLFSLLALYNSFVLPSFFFFFCFCVLPFF